LARESSTARPKHVGTDKEAAGLAQQKRMMGQDTFHVAALPSITAATTSTRPYPRRHKLRTAPMPLPVARYTISSSYTRNKPSHGPTLCM
jgi:hypothetical protein